MLKKKVKIGNNIEQFETAAKKQQQKTTTKRKRKKKEKGRMIMIL